MVSLAAVKPLNRWDHDSIRPGPVGSVGVPLVGIRLRSTAPGDFRWDKTYDGRDTALYGSSITDGSYRSFNSGAIGNKVIDRNWAFGRRFETSHGWYYQDLRVPDKRVEPYMGALPQYTWRNKIAEVNNAQRTGELFRFQPGGIVKDDSPLRGGMYPRVTNIEPGTQPAGGTGFEGTPQGGPQFGSSFTDQGPKNYSPMMSFAGFKREGRFGRMGVRGY